MVRKISENGGIYEEPPYTEEEEDEFYRRQAAGPFKVAHPSSPPSQPRKSPPERDLGMNEIDRR
jgi:hypothetical protein